MYLAGGSVFTLEEAQEEGKLLHVIAVPDTEGKDTTFTLYEDDGVSNDYQKGDYRKTKLTVTPGEVVTVKAETTGSYASDYTGVLLDVVAPDRAPYSAAVNGKILQHFLYRADFDDSLSGWYYDMERRSALVKFDNPEGDYQVDLSFTPNDLLGM